MTGKNAGVQENRQRRVPGSLLSPAARRLAMVAVAVCVAVVGILGALFTDRTQPGWLDRAVDGRIQAALGGHSRMLSQVIVLGGPFWVPVATVALVLACLAARSWRGAALAAIAVPVSGTLTHFLLKPLVHRTLAGDLSFPSGHTTGAFGLAAVIALLLAGPLRPRLPTAVRLLLTVAAFLAAATVAVSLVGLGAHYFTDTVGGVLVAVATVLTTALLLDRFDPSRRWPALTPEKGRVPGLGRDAADRQESRSGA